MHVATVDVDLAMDTFQLHEIANRGEIVFNRAIKRTQHLLQRLDVLDTMRKDADNYVPDGGSSWIGGAKTFLHKGVNGRWKDILSAEELALYDAACDRVLSDDCRDWLEFGGEV